MTWLFEGKELTEVDEKYVGYVYLITNTITNRQYIGKKLFFFKKTKQVKGKKKRYLAESDWREYWSSSDELKEDVKNLGEENFTREILRMCKTKGELSYYELKYQVEYDVLLHPEKFYNSWIFVKVRRSHLTKTIDENRNGV